jgi:hypothetical protein
MRAALWKVLSWLLIPLRMFGYATDIHTLWTNRDALLAVSVAVLGAGGSAVLAFSRAYPWYILVLFAVGGLLFVLWLISTGIEAYRKSQARRRYIPTQPPSTTTVKRKAVNDLLGNALEEGESLKQGRRYAIEGDESQELEEIEIGNDGQARHREEVRAWVDRTYDLIDDAFGRAQAQRFISNEGYTDEEVLGRKLPSSLHISSTERKYSLRARLKRLHELTDRMHNLDINPDFDPQDHTKQE